MNDYLKEVIQRVKELLPEDVAVEGDAPLCSGLGLSSMQLAQLAFELEETFDIEIPDRYDGNGFCGNHPFGTGKGIGRREHEGIK